MESPLARVKEDYRIVFYRLKYFTKPGPGSIVDRWFVSERIVSGKILKENIAK